MNKYFICNDCGKLIDFNISNTDEIIDNIFSRVHTCICGGLITMDNSFPSLSAQDFINTADLLFEKIVEKDKMILNEIQKNIGLENHSIDITKLDKYFNKYEEIRSKYQDNNKDNYLDISDEFDNYINKHEEYEIANIISLNMMLFTKNRFRKPYFIMALSIMEQLFNDYFNNIINSKLPPSGAITFLKAYENSGVQACINIIDSFLGEGLKYQMDNYVPGFYERWGTFRQIRNDIIHNNSKYISKITTRKIQKFIDEGIDVFAHLKGELISTYK